MKEKGPKNPESVFSVLVLPVGPLRAPEGFTGNQAQIWTDVVSSKAAGFFNRDSAGILEKYCVALDRSRFITAQLNELAVDGTDKTGANLEVIERLGALELRYFAIVASLATKMRLTQQARYKPDSSVVRKIPNDMPPPWETRD